MSDVTQLNREPYLGQTEGTRARPKDKGSLLRLRFFSIYWVDSCDHLITNSTLD